MWFLISVIFALLVAWLCSRLLSRIQKRELRKFLKPSKVKQAYQEIFELYKNVNVKPLLDRDRNQLHLNTIEFTYGEIQILSLAFLISKIKTESDKIFLDLGSGAGKAVIAMAKMFDFEKCRGIEILPSLVMLSKNLTDLAQIEFIQQDFLETALYPADIIFINATAFFGESLEKLKLKLTEAKPGAKIICVSKQLSEKHFKLIHQAIAPMSFGNARVFVYERF